MTKVLHKTRKTKLETAISTAIAKAGGLTALAQSIGSTAQAVSNWRKRKKIPASKCVAIELATGVSRRHLCPDWAKYWPANEA